MMIVSLTVQAQERNPLPMNGSKHESNERVQHTRWKMHLSGMFLLDYLHNLQGRSGCILDSIPPTAGCLLSIPKLSHFEAVFLYEGRMKTKGRHCHPLEVEKTKVSGGIASPWVWFETYKVHLGEQQEAQGLSLWPRGHTKPTV